MPRWWDKLLGRAEEKEAPSSPKQDGPPSAKWLAADDGRNPFGVPLLDLMMLQELISTSKDPAIARRSVSWGGSVGQELVAVPLLTLPAIECTLRYPAAKSLPDGILYAPPSMDFKWVIALREGRVLAARSWTGKVEAIADARREGDELVLERLRLAEDSCLRVCSRSVDVFDWLIRVHVWDQRLPMPVDDAYAAQLESTPMSGFGPFGKALFCAAKSWDPPAPRRPIRSDGEVIVATRKGDVAALQQAVARGADVDALGIHRSPALHLAVMKGDVALFDELVNVGAAPTVLDDRGRHALHVAVVHKAPLSLLERIASTKLDLTLGTVDGFTALHAAAEVNHPDVVPWLLAHGLELEQRTKRGHTALHIACALGHAEAAKALLEAGADINATSPDGTPRDVAVAQKKPESVALLDAWA